MEVIMFKRSSLLIGMAVLAGLVAPSVQAKGKCKNGVCRMAAVNKALKQRPVAKHRSEGKDAKWRLSNGSQGSSFT